MEKIIKGTSVFKSIVIGSLFIYKKEEKIKIPEKQSIEIEKEIFENAKVVADKQLEDLYAKTVKDIGEEEAMILEVQRLMILDIDLNNRINDLIDNEDLSSYVAVAQAGEEFSNVFASMDDEYMKARAVDVLDLTKRIESIIAGVDINIKLDKPSIIIAEDLTPSETLQLDRGKILGFVTRQGSSNSHTAILAGVLNIPTLIQTSVELDNALNNTTGIVDGIEGLLVLNPTDETISKYKISIANQEENKKRLDKLIGTKNITLDGKEIDLYANIGSPEDIDVVLKNDAMGIGLFRSEFLYLQRNDYPEEDEQYEAYSKVVKALDNKKVIIRTLDIGADKQADYFNLDKEENPALGFRAIRICLERPDLFKTQLRAIYRASAHGNVSIMFPMITSLWEVKEAKEIANNTKDELINEGIKVGEVEIGIMIETPSAVMIADELAKEVDFFSVGTNDLTQYTLAVDRQNSKLSRFDDPHHPAVMKMLEIISRTAIENNIWAGICGELAADTSVTEKLLQMGYTEFSVSPAYILPVREVIQKSNAKANVDCNLKI